MSAGGILLNAFAPQAFPRIPLVSNLQSTFCGFHTCAHIVFIFARTQTSRKNSPQMRGFSFASASACVFSFGLIFCALSLLAGYYGELFSFPLFSRQKMNIYYFIYTRSLITRLFAPFCLSAWREKGARGFAFATANKSARSARISSRLSSLYLFTR